MGRFWIPLAALFLGLIAGWIARDLVLSRAAGEGDPVAGTKVLAPVHLDVLLATGRFAEVAALSRDFGDFNQRVGQLSPRLQQQALVAWRDGRGEGFDVLIALSELAAKQGMLQQALDYLLASADHVDDSGDQTQLELHLAAVTVQLEKQLVADNRLDQLDRAYEQITLSLPELPDYFLQLGLLRIRLGNFDAALSPLSQIQNNMSLGSQARDLIAQAEASQAFQEASLEELPLRAAGSQFIVEAVIDDGASVALLIDTGAAMTVLDARLVERLGYSLNGPREYFSTAGGVVDAPVVTLSRLALGNSGISQLPVGALALSLPSGIDGLLGMNFLRHFEFRIDQEDRLLHLTNAR